MAALKALLIQAAAWLTVFAAARGMEAAAPSLLTLALSQGALAAGLALALRAESWWLPLHLGFSPALVLAQRLASARAPSVSKNRPVCRRPALVHGSAALFGSLAAASGCRTTGLPRATR